MDQNTDPNRASGLPRPSRLPTSKLPTFQSKLAQPSVSKKEEKAPTSRPLKPAVAVQKRSSIASLPRSQQPSTTRTAAATSTLTRPGSTYGRSVNHAPRISTSSSKGSSARPSSRATSVASLSSTVQSPANIEDEETHDRLSSLDSFRSTSRQSFQDESPLEEHREIRPQATPRDRKTSRPSLSDRTIESLQSVPSTPKDRRQSKNFFLPTDSPMGPPPRPGSRASRTGSNPNSRPGTSDGTMGTALARPASPAKKAPASARPASRVSTGGFGFTPGGSTKGRSVSTGLTNKLAASKGPAIQTPRSSSPSKPQTPSHNAPRLSKPSTASKPVASRAPKPRPSLSNTFGPAVRAGSPVDPPNDDHAIPPPTVKKVDTTRAVSSSSSALRQQIAAAKAAARKEKARHDSAQESPLSPSASNDVDIHVDPFNQAPKDEKHILRNRVNNARMDGRLNIAALSLKQLPEEVLTMYDSAAMAESNVNWAEVVDLTRLVAADNEIAVLDERAFPDKTPEELEAEEMNHLFGGLEAIDLHGNVLTSVPLGLRRLQRLTVLNLAHNKLENSALDVISQITTLKDLHLGHNSLSGNLSTSLCQLTNLESLDLQSNRLQGLPEALRELVSLKVLNVSGNQLTALPMEALQEVNLTQLDASSNVLIGSLFPLGGTYGHPTIQILKIANNSLAALSFSDSLDLPRLRELDVTNNHFTMLPSTSGWSEVVTLNAGDNKIAELPVGFSSLHRLKSANFTNNDLKKLDPKIANMDYLDHLILAANPLREKKFLNMSAYDIKRNLKERLEPIETDLDLHSAEETIDGFPASIASPSSTWALKSNGTLDLSNSQLSDSINDSLGSFLQSHEVTALHLQGNNLTAIPPALWLGGSLRILDLSGNKFGSDYLSDELALPALHELHIMHAGVTTLEPLLANLRAPNLKILNVSANRLSGPLPMLRTVYPSLASLFAADNGFTAVTAEVLLGFQAVNLSSNNIDRLPAEIGLLWDEGLKNLEIGSNAFRVPNYRVLEKGTEATLRWLRDRLPASMRTDEGEE